MTIIGPDPTDSVLSLESENVRVTGWVVETEPYYEEARLAVAPLRFGAGVKGKVGEALTFGVPMVMTPIASEGMHLLHGQHALIAEDPAEFAKNVVALLHDDELWHKLSLAGRLLIGERFSTEVTREMVGNVLNLGKSDRVTTWA
jgi:glycosyltransferase involved in cell wall biosynthesis